MILKDKEKWEKVRDKGNWYYIFVHGVLYQGLAYLILIPSFRMIMDYLFKDKAPLINLEELLYQWGPEAVLFGFFMGLTGWKENAKVYESSK